MKDHAKRAHAVLSASSAARWLACPPSAIAATLYPNTVTEFTMEGTAAHEVAEACAEGKAEEVRDSKDKHFNPAMIQYGLAYADYIKEQQTTADAVVLLEQRVDFSPWVPDGFGTADCLILEGHRMDVIDYKYGQGVPVSAEGNPQMRLYALGALNDYGFAYDVETIRTHIYQPRLCSISVEEISVSDLLAWAEGVKTTAAAAAKGEGEYTPGSHCRFCPHAGQCRALTDQCRAYVREFDLSVPKLAPHEVADVLKMEPLIDLWLRRVKAQAMQTLLDGGSVPGYKIVAGRGSRSWKDADAALAALIGAGYTAEAVTTKPELLSPAAMEKAIGKKKAGELLSDMIVKTEGAPQLAPESDKRAAYDPLAAARADFE